MKKLHCAIYTRKSSDEGLEQDFNSLDAQREACSAYIASQRSEGWKETPTRYDDGGYSGGTMNRPALARLLADIDAGRVNVVVVYKVDRLTRSLPDFARIVERLDQRGASFVSVTQSFNTTSSMGRLTLNVLLSFAQFEREVTSERIRDKIAASKKKGMWMGGTVPFGYLPDGRTLKVEKSEAEIIRWIFGRYLQLGSVHALKAEMDERGIVSRSRLARSGRITGGRAFSRGALFHLLRNRIYIGEIVHRGASWPGLQPPIVERELFDRVQGRLDEHGAAPARRGRASPQHPLTGIVRASDGRPMSPSSTRRRGKVYGYYVWSPLQQGESRRSDRPELTRISASALDDAVAAELRGMIGDPAADWPMLRPLIQTVRVHRDQLVLQLTPEAARRARQPLPDEGADGLIELKVQSTAFVRGGRTWIEGAGASIRRRPDRALVAGLRRGHAILAQAGMQLHGRQVAPRDAMAIADPYERSLTHLAFLAPDIQEMILNGLQPPGWSLQWLRTQELPISWAEQRRRLGVNHQPS